MPIDELYELNDERTGIARRNTSFSSVMGVVLSISYADDSDYRVSDSGVKSPQSYGSPTATVYIPSNGARSSGVRILQHGSARLNMSVWTPAVSTHRVLSDGRVVVPKRRELGDDMVRPIEWVSGTSVDMFDGDTVIIQNLPSGSAGSFASVIIGSIPKAKPAIDRLHMGPFSKNASEIGLTVGEYNAVEGAQPLATAIRSNNPSSELVRHPALPASNIRALPAKTDDQTLADYIASSYESLTVFDRTQANPVGSERYIAHNGSIVRIDQQGNIIVDTSLAGIQNNGIDPVDAAVDGDAGHIDVNILRRDGQGFNIRIGGELVFQIASDPSGCSVTLGREVAKAFSAVLGENLQEVFDNHQHMTAQGPTTIPLPVQDPLTAGVFPNEPNPVVKSSNIKTANKTSSPVFARDIILKQD